MFWKIYSILRRQPDVILASTVCSDPIVLDILAFVDITVAIMVNHVHGVVLIRVVHIVQCGEEGLGLIWCAAGGLYRL